MMKRLLTEINGMIHLNKSIWLTSILTLFAGFSIIGQHVLIEPISQVKTGYPSFVFNLDLDACQDVLLNAPLESDSLKARPLRLSLPMPSGKSEFFQVLESPIMDLELSEKFPNINTYAIKGSVGHGRISLTEKGFHAIIFTSKGTIYIDPLPNTEGYACYYRNDYLEYYKWTKGHQCELNEPSNIILPEQGDYLNRGERSNVTFRTYRLALSCTGEYASFHGGTASGALSAMVVTMNRVNGVYENEFALRMVLVGNNDTLIFLDSNTDPFTNNNGGPMLNQNQTTVNARIGSANYDIGHVFSTGGGGIAQLGCVCNANNKAKGVTGSNAPTGDAFDIDYVAHEMGHQFGANHPFNGTSGSCSGGNRNASTAWEPGSGSTIMAYAGICSPQDLQQHSDDYFHTGNVSEVLQFISGSGSCAVTTSSGNTTPIADAGTNGYTLPMETPFMLVGHGADNEGDDLTYCWEEYDLGPAGSPDNPTGNAPIFRSWSPTVDSVRICPRLVNIIIGNTVYGETYATYSRTLNFRLTVRDNNPNGGGVGIDSKSISVSGNAGPFEVTSPLQGEQVEAENSYLITWDVANTNLAPVNCSLVDIELCKYVTATQSLNIIETLAASTPNDGQEIIHISSTSIGSGYYIRVKAADHIFFNLNGGTFNVVAATAPDANIALNVHPNYNDGTLVLTWNDDFNNEDFFMIERSVGGNSSFQLLDSLEANITSYVDTAVTMYGQSYFYRVYAKNSQGNSSFSNEASYAGTGVSNLKSIGFKLYPNPAQNSAILNWETPGAINEICLFDVNGKMVLCYFKPLETHLIMDVKDLPPGQYVLHINSTSGECALPLQIAH